MSLRAGALRKRITFQSRSITQDTFGGQSTTWNPVTTIWGSIDPSGGRELMTAQSMNIDAPSTITVRWQPALANPKSVAAMRIIYGARTFNIHSIANQEERNRSIVMICSEGLNDG